MEILQLCRELQARQDAELLALGKEAAKREDVFFAEYHKRVAFPKGVCGIDEAYTLDENYKALRKEFLHRMDEIRRKYQALERRRRERERKV